MSEEFKLGNESVEDRGVQRKTSESVPKRTSSKPKERPEEGPDLFDVAEKSMPPTPAESDSTKRRQDEGYFNSDEYFDQPGDDNPYARSRR